MPPTTLDFSEAYLGIADVLRTIQFSAGSPKKIGEGLFMPSTTQNQGLPYVFIATDGEMAIDWDSGPTQQCDITIPVTVYYIRSNVSADTMTPKLRSDGSKMALAFWRSKLPHNGVNTVYNCVPVSVDWSDTNAYNQQATENDWPSCAVAVTLELRVSVSK
jgi:hypothetical protein